MWRRKRASCSQEAEKQAKRARADARRREKEAIARAERQAERMLEQQKRSYEAMQKMIPEAPETPKYREASTTTERVEVNQDEAAVRRRRPRQRRERRGRRSLLIGLTSGTRGGGTGPNIM